MTTFLSADCHFFSCTLFSFKIWSRWKPSSPGSCMNMQVKMQLSRRHTEEHPYVLQRSCECHCTRWKTLAQDGRAKRGFVVDRNSFRQNHSSGQLWKRAGPGKTTLTGKSSLPITRKAWRMNQAVVVARENGHGMVCHLGSRHALGLGSFAGIWAVIVQGRTRLAVFFTFSATYRHFTLSCMSLSNVFF